MKVKTQTVKTVVISEPIKDTVFQRAKYGYNMPKLYRMNVFVIDISKYRVINGVATALNAVTLAVFKITVGNAFVLLAKIYKATTCVFTTKPLYVLKTKKFKPIATSKPSKIDKSILQKAKLLLTPTKKRSSNNSHTPKKRFPNTRKRFFPHIETPERQSALLLRAVFRSEDDFPLVPPSPTPSGNFNFFSTPPTENTYSGNDLATPPPYPQTTNTPLTQKSDILPPPPSQPPKLHTPPSQPQFSDKLPPPPPQSPEQAATLSQTQFLDELPPPPSQLPDLPATPSQPQILGELFPLPLYKTPPNNTTQPKSYGFSPDQNTGSLNSESPGLSPSQFPVPQAPNKTYEIQDDINKQSDSKGPSPHQTVVFPAGSIVEEQTNPSAFSNPRVPKAPALPLMAPLNTQKTAYQAIPEEKKAQPRSYLLAAIRDPGNAKKVKSHQTLISPGGPVTQKQMSSTVHPIPEAPKAPVLPLNAQKPEQPKSKQTADQALSEENKAQPRSYLLAAIRDRRNAPKSRLTTLETPKQKPKPSGGSLLSAIRDPLKRKKVKYKRPTKAKNDKTPAKAKEETSLQGILSARRISLVLPTPPTSEEDESDGGF